MRVNVVGEGQNKLQGCKEHVLSTMWVRKPIRGQGGEIDRYRVPKLAIFVNAIKDFSSYSHLGMVFSCLTCKQFHFLICCNSQEFTLRIIINNNFLFVEINQNFMGASCFAWIYACPNE